MKNGEIVKRVSDNLLLIERYVYHEFPNEEKSKIESYVKVIWDVAR